MYNQNYTQDPTQARLNALYLKLCSTNGSSSGQLTITNSCFVATDPTGKQVVQLCFNGFSFPADNASLINLDVLPGETALLFDNQLTNYIATPLPGNRSYVRGIIMKVLYPSLDANGVAVNPSLYTCKLNITNLQDNQVPPFVSGGLAVNVNATTAAPNFLPITALASTITLNGVVAATGGATIAKYQWTKVTFPVGDISGIYSPNTAVTKVTNLVPGQYVFKLTVTDSNGVTASSTGTSNVANITDTPPTVNAGANQIITLQQAQVVQTLQGTATVNGASTSIVSTSWSQTGGPGTATIVTPSALTTQVLVGLPGIYTFELTATDNQGFVATSTVTITVTSLQSFSMPLNTLYSHLCNPVTTDATQLLNSLSVTNISANMPICIQALLISDKSDPSTSTGINNNCNC